MNPETKAKHRQLILAGMKVIEARNATLFDRPPVCKSEIAYYTGLDWYAVNRRMSELEKAERVVRVDRLGKSPDGNLSLRYKLK
jgi:hypothetical protein